MRRMSIVYLILVNLLVPSIAYAWGPGTHLEIALYALAHAPAALPVIRDLMRRHPAEFIYGSVSPDITQGKKFAGYKHHCHNWDIGRMILEEAATDTERAAAYGYLTHLAADTVAHNYYVPFKMIRSYSTRSLSHIYWEMRFDLHVPDLAWEKMPQIIRSDFTEFDHLLNRVLKKNLFTFGTNKKIYNTILNLQKMKRLRGTLKTYARKSHWTLKEEQVEHYKNLTFKVVEEFLSQFGKARCLIADPAGLRKQAYALALRRKMKRTRGITPPVLEKIRKALLASLFDPNILLPDLEELV